MNRQPPHQTAVTCKDSIHPLGGHGRSIIAGLVAVLLVLQAFIFVRDVNAQPVDEIAGAPVDIHSGTCEEPVLEPIFDAGELGSDTLQGIQDDDLSQVGLRADEAAGARGVDLDGDGALAENEIIGGIDTDAPVAWATADFDQAIDVEQPTVVIVHADPDAGYSTFIACGSITDTQPDDEGRRIVPLAPQGEYTVIGYAVLGEDGQTLSTYMFEPGDVPAATPAAMANAPQGPFPVDIHSGTCTDWTTEPVYDLSDMELTNVSAEGEQETGDTEAQLPDAAAEVGPVYQVKVDETEFNGTSLFEEGAHVVAVHKSAEEYETLIACGPVLDFTDGDNLLVPLLPVSGSNLTGIAMMAAEGGGFSAYLWQCEPIEAPTEEEPTVAPTEAPTQVPTEEPTPTVEPTPTEEPTVVIEETEEVPAPTATALAEQEDQQQTIELGDESPGALTATVDQPLVITNTSDVDRVFRVEELGIEETIPAGEDVEIQLPEDTEPGEYAYQVLENDEPIFEDTLTVE